MKNAGHLRLGKATEPNHELSCKAHMDVAANSRSRSCGPHRPFDIERDLRQSCIGHEPSFEVKNRERLMMARNVASLTPLNFTSWSHSSQTSSNLEVAPFSSRWRKADEPRQGHCSSLHCKDLLADVYRLLAFPDSEGLIT